MKKLWHKILAYTICSVFASALFGGWAFGAFSQYGLPGIYNATPFTLTSGQGSALSLDSQGRAILSPSSSLSSITATSGVFATITATTGTFSNLTVTVINSSSRYLADSGSSTVPAYSFNGDENTGMYRIGADNLGFTTGGTERVSITSAGRVGFNSSSPVAGVAATALAGVIPMQISSSTGARMFTVETNGQVTLGPNSLLQTGGMVLEHSTANNIALAFTNGSDYTFQLGRVSSGVAYSGGPTGSTYNLRANGIDQVFIRANGTMGIGSSTPNYNLSVSGTVAFPTMGTNITGNGVCVTTAGQITNAGAAACVPSALKYKTHTSLYTKSATKLFTDLVEAGAVQNYELKNKLGDPRKGLIADVVEKVDPNLVGYSDDGSVNTLHFEDLTGLSVQAIAELDKRVTSLEQSSNGSSKKLIDWIQWGVIAVLGLGLVLKRN